MSPIDRAHQSERALSRNADVFIWHYDALEKLYIIIACYNSSALAPVTVGSLLRWFRLLEPVWPADEIALTPAEVEYRMYLKYACKPSSDGPLDGATQLGPGDYLCYALPPIILEPDISTPFAGTINYVRGPLTYFKDTQALAQKMNEISAEHRAQTTTRYGRQCLFTGSSGGSEGANHEVDAHWIYSPSRRYTVAAPLLYREVPIRNIEWQVPANLLPMRADVYKLWLENAISVDVDDDYRVIRFDQSAANIASELVDRLTLTNEDKLRDAFLREHFRYTVAWRIPGGDIMDDEDSPALFMNCQELYARVEHDKRCAAGEVPEKLMRRDKRWNTLAGELVREYIREKPHLPVSENSTRKDDDDEDLEEDTDNSGWEVNGHLYDTEDDDYV